MKRSTDFVEQFLRFKDQVFSTEEDRAGTEGYWINRIAHEAWKPEFVPIGQSASMEGLFLVLEGRGEHRSGGRRWDLRPGAVMRQRVGRDFATRSEPEAPLEFLVVALSGCKAAGFVDETLGGPAGVLYPHNAEEIRRVMEDMFDSAKAGSRVSIDLCRQYVPVLLLTIRKGLESSGWSRGVRFQHFQRGKVFLDTHFTRLQSAYEAAEALGLSHGYFCRLFREMARVSPHQYLLRLKLNFAARLLQTTPVTLEALADQLCYANPFVFSRAFKKHYGVAPREYRRTSAPRGGPAG